MSTSSKTTTGALPPSSRWTRFRVSAAARGTREEPQVVDHERNLVLAERVDGLARVVGFELGDLLGVLFDRVGELQQRKCALSGSGRPPPLERGAGGVDRTVDVGGAR